MSDIYKELASFLANEEKSDKVSSDLMNDISFSPSTDTSYMDNLLSDSEVDTSSLISGIKMGGKQKTSVRNLLADAGEGLEYVSWPPAAGTRVAFKESLEAMFAYKNAPDPGENGTIVLVRCAHGDTTHTNEYAFVKFDSGRFMHIHKDHLTRAAKTKTASNLRLRVASLGDLTSFFNPSSRGELVHKSSRDLWSLKKEGDSYVLNRLFDEYGNPITQE